MKYETPFRYSQDGIWTPVLEVPAAGDVADTN